MNIITLASGLGCGGIRTRAMTTWNIIKMPTNERHVNYVNTHAHGNQCSVIFSHFSRRLLLLAFSVVFRAHSTPQIELPAPRQGKLFNYAASGLMNKAIWPENHLATVSIWICNLNYLILIKCWLATSEPKRFIAYFRAMKWWEIVFENETECCILRGSTWDELRLVEKPDWALINISHLFYCQT